MQVITITGRVGKDAEIRSHSSGPICSFNVASTQGYGDKESTNWFRCTLWGKRGETLGKYLLKGQQVTVSGELEVEDYQGKTQLNIRVNDVALQGQRGGGSQGGGSAPRDDGWTGGGFDDDLNDDVPF